MIYYSFGDVTVSITAKTNLYIFYFTKSIKHTCINGKIETFERLHSHVVVR